MGSIIKIGCVTVIEYPPGSDAFVLAEETKGHKRGRLNLPGGGLNGKREKGAQESLLEAARREAREETGLTVELTSFLGLFNYTEDGQLHVAFAARAIAGQLQASDEHPTVESYTYEDIEAMAAGTDEQGRQLRSERVIDAIRQFRSGPMLPLEYVRILDTDALSAAAIVPFTAQAA